MTIRTKTIEYVCSQTTSTFTSGSLYTAATETITIPENTTGGGVTFRSVLVEVSSIDTNTTSVGLTQIAIGVKLGSASTDTQTVANSYGASSGVACNFFFTRNNGLVSYFQTNFGSGVDQTFVATVTHTGPSVNNIAVKLIITYDYDTSSATQIKTVKIPLESYTSSFNSNTALLSNTSTQIGTNQVPQLTGSGGFLKEASISIKDAWFEIFVSESEPTSTTDFTLGLQLDSAGVTSDGSHEANLSRGAIQYRRIWKRYSGGAVDFTTTATHQFKASSSVTGRFGPMSIKLIVTYTYDEASTTEVTNSIEIPINSGTVLDRLGTSSGTDPSATRLQFYIEEPGTITLLQSGVEVRHDSNFAPNLYTIRCGSQSNTSYHPSPSVAPSHFPMFIHRIDSGGSAGVGVTLDRGLNTLDVYASKASTAAYQTPVSYYTMILNYSSSKSSQGTGAHNHTVMWDQIGLVLIASSDVSVTFAPTFQETNYYVTAYGLYSVDMISTTDISPVYVKRASGEGANEWYQQIMPTLLTNSGSNASFKSWTHNISDAFTRYPGDPDSSRLGLTTSRTWRVIANKTFGQRALITYHACTSTVAGTVTGYTGDGSGITVDLHDALTDEKEATTTTSTGGTYSIKTYDNTREKYVEVYQTSSAKPGRSPNSFPVLD